MRDVKGWLTEAEISLCKLPRDVRDKHGFVADLSRTSRGSWQWNLGLNKSRRDLVNRECSVDFDILRSLTIVVFTSCRQQEEPLRQQQQKILDNERDVEQQQKYLYYCNKLLLCRR